MKVAAARRATGAPPTDAPTTRLRWWREALYIAAFYAVYTAIRDTQGSAGGGQTAPSTTAFRHARDVIRVEKDLLIYHERTVQHAFIHAVGFLRFWNVWYGTAHFVITGAIVVWLFRRRPDRYPFWRNTLAVMTGLALIGFSVFPLMPPRLLPASYGFVDTLARFGGSWSFDSGAMQKVSNQFAAMPSLHIGWSMWCMFATLPACRHWWSRALAVGYPVATLFCIVVTGNHYFLDAVGGLIVLAGGVAIAQPATAWIRRRA